MKISVDWKTILAGVVLLAAAITLLARSCTSEEQRIRQRFEKLCRINELDGVESTIQAGISANQISEYFTPNLVIEAASAPISVGSLQEFRQIVFKARSSLELIDIDVRKLDVQLDPSGERASMSASLRIHARGMGGRETFNEAFNIDWSKEQNEWKISRVSRYETIRMIE
jgi:ketosteroid isomerase-like protein